VADQRHDPGSQHSWVARAIRVRRECPELGWGEWRTIDVGDQRVLGIETRWREHRMITLHNLSADQVKVRLPEDQDERMRQVLGDAGSPYQPGEPVTLGRYGFSWLRRSGAFS
jgi:maltose alpha-D-glucosyltransferase/alpha-amylase